MGKYLKKFDNHDQYNAFIGWGGFIKPNVSHCILENEVHYNPIPHDYSKDYLTFVAREDGATFTFNGVTVNGTTNNVNYSIDNGETWTEIESGVSTPVINNGEKILWKSNEMVISVNPFGVSGIGHFSSNKMYDAEGNIMSLLYGDEFDGEESLQGKGWVFTDLFGKYKEQCNIVNAEKLILPATILAEYCYSGMFGSCTSLTKAPELPATTLAEGCYHGMFSNCTNLTATPELPATTLALSCYYSMFNDCTSLTTAPELPATTLTSNCYEGMFYDCTSLNYIKAMFTTEPSADYTFNWVSGVASTGTFVKNSAATWNVSGVNGIPEGWTIETATA